jgi:hypothetical protein
MKLAEAVANRHLVQWFDNGFVRTLEPHVFARLQGGREVLIAFQNAGGPAVERQRCWKLVDATDRVTVDEAGRFDRCRRVPQHLQALVCSTYASAAPGAGFAVPRR